LLLHLFSQNNVSHTVSHTIVAADKFRSDGYTVESLKSALPKAELMEKLKDVYILGIRSASDLTADVLRSAKRLLAIGCFCIGTNQVDLDTARSCGIPVFNSPFSNSRSVAELIIGQIIVLARKLGEANAEMHAGQWKKYTTGRVEIRGVVCSSCISILHVY
jgi:D-3-phosphoglycerate dehydrogenase